MLSLVFEEEAHITRPLSLASWKISPNFPLLPCKRTQVETCVSFLVSKRALKEICGGKHKPEEDST